MKIIDMHAHIYPDKIAQKAIANIGDFYHIDMRATKGTPMGLLEAGDEVCVYKFVVHSTATSAKQVSHINDFIMRETAKHSEFVGFGTLHPNMAENEIIDEVERIIDGGLKGIKLHPDFQMFNIDDTEAEKIYRVVEGRLPILFHTGDERYDYSRPERLACIARRFPNLIVIGAHFGGYSRWDEVNVYKGLENVWFDTSSTLFKLDFNKAIDIINTLGKERFMFGSDYPMWLHKEEVDRVKKLALPNNVKEDIFYNNAKYFLEMFCKTKV